MDENKVAQLAQELLTVAEQKKPELTDEEEERFREGLALEEMRENNPGWQVVRKLLDERAYHTWANPREAKDMTEWNWMELNTYYAAATARELIEIIDKAVSDAHYLQKVKNGEVGRGRGSFKI